MGQRELITAINTILQADAGLDAATDAIGYGEMLPDDEPISISGPILQFDIVSDVPVYVLGEGEQDIDATIQFDIFCDRDAGGVDALDAQAELERIWRDTAVTISGWRDGDMILVSRPVRTSAGKIVQYTSEFNIVLLRG